MKFIAVTACPTGIAHTFMAKKGLEDAAKKLGFSMKVETQGANGIENELTLDDIAACDILILAAEVGLNKRERFDGVKKVNIPISMAIKNPVGLLQKIADKVQEEK